MLLLLIEHRQLAQGVVQHETGVAHALQSAPVFLPAEGSGGDFEQRVVAGPPAVGQQLGDALLEGFLGVDRQQARVVQVALEQFLDLHELQRLARLRGGEFIEYQPARGARMFNGGRGWRESVGLKRGRGWHGRCIVRRGSGGLIRMVVCARAVILFIVAVVSQPVLRRVARFAQRLETFRVEFLVDQLELARVGALEHCLVGAVVQAEALQVRRDVAHGLARRAGVRPVRFISAPPGRRCRALPSRRSAARRA